MAAATGPASQFKADPKLIRELLPEEETSYTSSWWYPKSIIIKSISTHILLDMHIQTMEFNINNRPHPPLIKNCVIVKTKHQNGVLSIRSVSIESDRMFLVLSNNEGLHQGTVRFVKNINSDVSVDFLFNGNTTSLSRLPSTGSSSTATGTGPATFKEKY